MSMKVITHVRRNTAQAPRALAVALLLMPLMAGCKASGPKDIMGVSSSVTKWQPIDPAGSVLLYESAADKPKIVSIRRRLRNKTETQELIRIASGGMRPSHIVVTYLDYGTYYSHSTTQVLHDKSVMVARAKREFPAAKVSKVIAAKNRKGRYLYTVADYGGGDRCVLAIQGYDLKFTATRTDMTYDAIVTMRYCSQQPVARTLRMFDGMYMKE